MCGHHDDKHVFELSNLGTAPFQVIGFIDMPARGLLGTNPSAYNNHMREAGQIARAFGVRLGSCDHCGTGIINHFVIQSSDGVRFVVGCDCVMKTGDAGLVSEIKRIRSERARLRRAEKRAEARKERARQWKRDAKARRRAAFAEFGDDLRIVWPHRKNGFIRDVLARFARTGYLSEAQVAAMVQTAENAHLKAQFHAASEHIPGAAGERLIVSATCVSRTPIETAFGTSILAILHTDGGNVLKVFGKCPLQKGERRTIKATVKSFGEYKGVKQTQINRVSIVK